MEILKKLNWTMIISLVLWCAVTLIRVFNHSPWIDEAHAWMIAQELNFFEIIKLMKVEGHTFLWYLCLMPFAKADFMYPYSMLLLNWLFCFIAVLILWLRAPFNNWIKFFITFSFPFLTLYPIIARCYAIGIMFLFAITAMEKDKLNHPNWYALLLILCANTSVMAAVGATVFGIFFVFELIKNKRNLIVPFFILLMGAVIFLVQLCGVDSKNVSENLNIFSVMFLNTFFKNIILNVSLLIIFSCCALVFYIKNKIFPFFLIGSFTILLILLTIYSGGFWHWFFFYIYFIISSWLLFDKYSLKYKNLYIVLLCAVAICYIFFKPFPYIYKLVYQDYTKGLKTYINNSELFKNSNLIIVNFRTYPLIPYYTHNSAITVKNYCSGSSGNYDTVPFYSSEYCYYDKGYAVKYVYDQMDKVYDKNKRNILLGAGMKDYFAACDTSSRCYKFIPIDISDRIRVHMVYKEDEK